MGVVIQDKSASYNDAFDAIISAAEGAISIGYFGDNSTPSDLRLGDFNATGKTGSMTPTGSSALLRPEGGLIVSDESSSTNPSRFVHSWMNKSAKCAAFVVADIKTGGGVLSFAGTRTRVGLNRALGVSDAEGTSREMTATLVPEGPVCIFINSDESAYQSGFITPSGEIFRVAYSNADRKFTAADRTAYMGGIGYGITGFRGPNIFYSSAAFDRFLTDDELVAQAQQLIRYANSIGAGMV